MKRRTFAELLTLIGVAKDTSLLIVEPKWLVLFLFQCSHVRAAGCKMLTNSLSLWLVDFGGSYHIIRNKETQVDFRQIPYGMHWICVNNNSKVEV